MSKNIVLISLKYPPNYSGYGRQLKSVLEHFDFQDEEISFTLLTAYDSSVVEETENMKVVTFGIDPAYGSSRLTYIFSYRVFKWLLKNRSSYSLIHCIKAGPEAMAANYVSKLKNVPLIVKVAQDELTDKELDTTSTVSKWVRKSRHASLKTADFFIAISRDIRENLEKRVSGKSRIISIPNGVNTSKFQPAEAGEKEELREKLGLPADEVVCLFVGAINKRKGIFDLLNAVKDLDTVSKARLVLCGPNLENMDVEAVNESLSHKNIKVDYRGKVDDVDDYMKASDVFILPSYSEGLPNVVLEAGATGLPLIGTDIGGTQDIISEGENGYLVPTGSPEKLSEAMRKLIDDRQLRESMGAQARKIISERYSIKQVADNYKKLYLAILK